MSKKQAMAFFQFFHNGERKWKKTQVECMYENTSRAILDLENVG
jgi:hypothetical protein